jgi:hypothetical protein
MHVKPTASVDVSTSASVLDLGQLLSVLWLKGLTPLSSADIDCTLSPEVSEYVDRVVEVPVKKVVEKTVEKIVA